MSFKKHVGTYVFNILKPKPKLTKGESFKVKLKKDSGKFKMSYMPTIHKIDKTSKELRKKLQKIKGEKVTESGVSKGKDIKK